MLDQWFFVNDTLKSCGKSKFGRHLLVFPVEISCIGKKSPTVDTANVDAIWRLSSILLTGMFSASLMLMVYFPVEISDNRV